MAVVRWILLALVAALATGTWVTLGVGQPAAESAAARFHCPMHPQIRSAEEGTCPICGMRLEPIGEKAAPPPSEGSSPAPSGVVPVMLTLERRQSIGISTSPARADLLGPTRRFPAMVEVPRSSVAEVHVRSAGFVEQVMPIETGTKVKAGQPLAWIYSPEVLRAEGDLRGAHALSGADHGSAIVDGARDRLRFLGAGGDPSKDAARKPSGMFGVVAPISGVVTAREVVRGGYVMPEEKLFEIVDYGKLWATATMSSADVAELPAGTRGTFVAARSAKRFDVTLAGAAPEIATATRTAKLRFSLATEGELLPGEIGEVAVELPSAPRVLVPRDAVIDLGKRAYVFVEREGGLFEPRAVELGPLIGGERAILRGVVAGEVVVTRGAFLLDSESRLDAAIRTLEPPSP
jgi:Cu(I)/Ag(I) efflux system membrane fusion protein